MLWPTLEWGVPNAAPFLLLPVLWLVLALLS